MGYVALMANCFQCGMMFSSNPDLVPSMRLKNGTQVVFCKSCVEAANPQRIKNGLQPIHIFPGTYEPAPEHPDDEPFEY